MDYGLPLTITLESIGRRFNREWIFRNVNYTFTSGGRYAVLGANGSGKSTLLQVLMGSLGASAGKINYTVNGSEVNIAEVFKYLAISAPYMELIEDFTLAEMIDFHFKFKSYLPGVDKDEVLQVLDLSSGLNKQVKYFSSGMKQRLKLALAFCSDTPALMLDEPTSNLDAQGIHWYRNLIERFTVKRLTVICSNQPHEYDFCDKTINIADYKK